MDHAVQQDSGHAPHAVEQAATPRRSVLRIAFGSAFGLGLAALGTATGLWTAAVARLMVPRPASPLVRWRKIGLPSDFPPDSVETKYHDSPGIWVVHGVYGGRRQIYALRVTCTHLGCITYWDDRGRRFRCPCHGSGFRLDGGVCEGPAPRPLERCAIRLADDGQLEVDPARTFREELGQWTHPASYVRT
jgi:cytochrome b6-f complex iron-sulfur subunit